jgi:uncharacterized protein YndB with AHSA1/START domain
MMKSIRLACLVVLPSAVCAAVAAEEVRNSSFVGPDGGRVLQQSIVVSATPRQLWDAFTTTDGLRTWAVPVVHADFRLGGMFESTYRLDGKIGAPGNIKNQYLSYVPLRMVAFQAVAAPPTFPHKELLADIFTVAEFEPVDERRTRVTLSMVGYRPGDGYETIYRLFERGNAISLERLRQSFATGPIDWKRIAGEAAKPK